MTFQLGDQPTEVEQDIISEAAGAYDLALQGVFRQWDKLAPDGTLSDGWLNMIRQGFGDALADSYAEWVTEARESAGEEEDK